MIDDNARFKETRVSVTETFKEIYVDITDVVREHKDLTLELVRVSD